MLDFKTLKEKPKIDDEMLDLTSEGFNYEGASISKVIIVDDYYKNRLDLISFMAYGSDEYMDIIAKYNGIRDMFHVPVGSYIAIPVLNSIKQENSKNEQNFKITAGRIEI